MDCRRRHAWTGLYPNKLRVTAVQLTNNDVLPTFGAQGAKIDAVLLHHSPGHDLRSFWENRRMEFAMMEMTCDACLLRSRAMFRPLTQDELKFVARMRRRQMTVGQGKVLATAGDSNGELYTIVEGWAARYRLMADKTRHMVDVLLPGDLAGLEGNLTGRTNSIIASLTPIRFCVLDGKLLPQLMTQHPDLCMALMRLCAEGEQRSDTHSALLATAGAAQRLAFLFLQIFERLKVRGLTYDTMCPFPLRRAQLADAAGLSEVHVSRTLAEFRRDGLIHLADNILMIRDRSGLAKIAAEPASAYSGNQALL
jgi:CRP/FNR family transcriptional regulator, anaerobic regulatory protein